MTEHPNCLLGSNNAREYKTKDTYKAAYLIIQGAEFGRAHASPVKDKKRERKGFGVQWTVTLTDVPRDKIDLYAVGKAMCNPEELSQIRTGLKRDIKNYLNEGWKTYEKN